MPLIRVQAFHVSGQTTVPIIKKSLGLIGLLILAFFPVITAAEEDFIIVQSTTSTENSGLFDFILPMFTDDTGIDVRVVAVGTGQAIKNAINGDGDVLFVHSRKAEEKFVADGYGTERFDVMFNDFVLVGPADDPANISGQTDISLALERVAQGSVPFLSRGDDSGTHKAELRLWADTSVDISQHSGTWYRESGSGMGATLNAAVTMGAYTLTDRATWISFANKSGHQIMAEGDPRLFNQYGVIAVNPAVHPHVKQEFAQEFVDWLLSPHGQNTIANFKIDGQQLFFPNASP